MGRDSLCLIIKFSMRIYIGTGIGRIATFWGLVNLVKVWNFLLKMTAEMTADYIMII